MYKGIYIAASGAVLKQTQLELISQNIANANTPGYKKESLAFKDYLFQQEAGGGPDGRVMSDYGSAATDLSNGNAVKTGNPLDIAVEGSGFIALEGDRYTRRGDFKKDGEGFLTTQDGIRVLGQGGPISLPADSVEISIDLEGKVSVLQAGGTLPVEIDTLKIVEFGPEAKPLKAGSGLFTIEGAVPTVSTAAVKQGYLETSNVDIVKEMVVMIEAMREFEAYQRAIHVFDNATGKVTNELGRL